MPVSIVIPFYGKIRQINKLLFSILKQSYLPSEIIIINVNDYNLILNNKLTNIFLFYNINIKIINKKNAFPGSARNSGILEASNDLIGFLDLNTIPPKKWLEYGINLLKNSNNAGVWGYTYYDAVSHKEQLIRASTFGTKPIKTLPGTIVNKNFFQITGLFINTVRAGEDTDWILRLELHKILMFNNIYPTKYIGLLGFSYKMLFKKWYRNYFSASYLPYLSEQKSFYVFIFSFFLIFIAFCWNWIMAGWRVESSYYIPNVTKIVLLIFSFLIIFFRSFILPVRKGITINYLLPFNFIFILFISTILDIIKLFAFIKYIYLSRIKKS
jgi:glycosyltransferase involved in cell wall biosynthesis